MAASGPSSSVPTPFSSDDLNHKLFVAPLCTFVPPPLGEPSALEQPPAGSEVWGSALGVGAAGATRPGSAAGGRGRRVLWISPTDDANGDSVGLRAAPCSNKAYSQELQQARQLLLLQPPSEPQPAWSTSSTAHAGDAPNSAQVSGTCDQYRSRNVAAERGSRGASPPPGENERQVAVVNLLTQGGFRLLYFLVKNWSSSTETKRRISRGDEGGPGDAFPGGEDDDDELGLQQGGDRNGGAERPRELQVELLQLLAQVLDGTRRLVKSCAAPAGSCTAGELALQLLVLRRLHKGAAVARRRKKKRGAWAADEGETASGSLLGFDDLEEDSDLSSPEDDEEEDENEEEGEEVGLASRDTAERQLRDDGGAQEFQRILSGQDAVDVCRTMRSLVLCVTFFADWLLRRVVESIEQQAAAFAGGGASEAVGADTFGSERLRVGGPAGGRWGRAAAAANAAAGKARNSKAGSRQRGGPGAGQQRGSSSVVSSSKRAESTVRRRARRQRTLDSDDDDSGIFMSDDEGENEAADEQKTAGGTERGSASASLFSLQLGSSIWDMGPSGDKPPTVTPRSPARRRELFALLDALGNLGGSERMWRAFASEVGGEQKEENVERLQLVRALLRPLALLYDEEKTKAFTRLPPRDACSCLYADGASAVAGSSKTVVVEPLKQTAKAALQKVLQQIERQRQQKRQQKRQQEAEKMRSRGNDQPGEDAPERCNEEQKEQQERAGADSVRGEADNRDTAAAAGGSSAETANADDRDSDEEEEGEEGAEEQTWRTQLDSVVLKPECRALIEILASPELRDSRLPVRLARELAQQLREQLLLCGGVERATLAQRQIFSMTAGSLEELARVLPRVWLKEKRLLLELFAADAYHIRKALLECLRMLLLRAHRVLELNEAEEMEASSSSGAAGGRRCAATSDSETEERRPSKRMRLPEADSADEDEWWQQPDISARREGLVVPGARETGRRKQPSDAAVAAGRRFWAAQRGELLRLLLERLQDKTPLARSWALKVLADLIGEKEALPPAGILQAVRAASKRLLDKSTLVRGAAFSVLAALLHVALKQLEQLQQQQQRPSDDAANDAWQPFLFLLISLPEDWHARRKAIRDQKARNKLRGRKTAEAGRKTTSRAGDLAAGEEAATTADEEAASARGVGAASQGEDDDAEEEFACADPDELLLCAEDALNSALRSCEDLLLSTAEGDQKAALRFIVDACVTLQLRRPQLLSSLHHAFRLAFSSSGALVTLLLQEFRRLFLDPLSLEQQQQRLFNQQLLRRAWQQQLLEQLRREQETLRRLQRKQQQLQRQVAQQQPTALQAAQQQAAQHKTGEHQDNLEQPKGHNRVKENTSQPTGVVNDREQKVEASGCPTSVVPAGCGSAAEELVAVTKTNGAAALIPGTTDPAAASERVATSEAVSPAEATKTDAALQLAAAAVAAATASVRALKEQLECMQRAPRSTPFQQLLVSDESDSPRRGAPLLTTGGQKGRGDSSFLADAVSTAESIFRFGACKLIELARAADVSAMACIEKLLGLAFSRDDGGVQQQHHQLWALKHTADALFSLALTPGSGPRCIRLGERSSRCALGLLRLLFEASRRSVMQQQQHHQQDVPGSLCGSVGPSALRGGSSRSSSSQLSPQKRTRDAKLAAAAALSQVATAAAAAGALAGGLRLHCLSNAQFMVLVKGMRRALAGGSQSGVDAAAAAHARGAVVAAAAVRCEESSADAGSSSSSKKEGEPDFCTFTEMCWIISASLPDRRSARAAVVALELLMEHYGTDNTHWFAAAQAVVELTFAHCDFPERLWTRVLSRLLCPLALGSTADRSASSGASSGSGAAACGSSVNSSIRNAAVPASQASGGGAAVAASYRPSLTSNCDFSALLETPIYGSRYALGSCLNEEALQQDVSPARPAVTPAALTPGPRTNTCSAADGTQQTERMPCSGPAEAAAPADATGQERGRDCGPGPGQRNVDTSSGCGTAAEQEADGEGGVGKVAVAGSVPPGGGSAFKGELQRQQPVSLWMLAHLVFLAGHIALRVCVLLEEQHAEAKRGRLMLHHVRRRSSRSGARREAKKSRQTASASKKRRSSGEIQEQQNTEGGRSRGKRSNGSATEATAGASESPHEWAPPPRAQDDGQLGGQTPPKKHHQRRAAQQRQWDGGTSSVAGGGGEEDSEDEEEAEAQGSAGIGDDVEMNMGMQTKEEEEAELFAHILETEVVGSGLLGHPLKRLILVAALEPQRLLRPAGGSRNVAALPPPPPSTVSVSRDPRHEPQQAAPVSCTPAHTAAAEEKKETETAEGAVSSLVPGGETGGDAGSAASCDALTQLQNTTVAAAEREQRAHAATGDPLGATPAVAASTYEGSSPPGLEELHAAAVVALCKYATVSRSFCESRICQRTSVLHALVSLLFSRPTTAKSRGNRNTCRRLPSTLRQTLLICYGDLTCRHPNAVEPYNDIVFGILRDEDEGVRHTAVQVLTHLVMNGMVKAKGRLLVLMLLLLSDRDPRIAAAAETFFYEVDRKAAYAVLNAFPELLSALAAACCCTGSNVVSQSSRTSSTAGSGSGGGDLAGATSSAGVAVTGRSGSSGGKNSSVAAVRSASGAQPVTQQQEPGKTMERGQQGNSAKQTGGEEQQSPPEAAAAQTSAALEAGSKRTDKAEHSDARQRNKEKDDATAARGDETQLPLEDGRAGEANAAREHQRLLKFLLQFVKHHRHTETLVERIAQRIATLPLPAVYTAKKQRFAPSSDGRGSVAAAPSAGDLGAAVTQQQRDKGRGAGGVTVQLPLDPLAAMALLNSPEELSSLHLFGTSFKDPLPNAASPAGQGPPVLGGAAQAQHHQQGSQGQEEHQTDAGAAAASQQQSSDQQRPNTPQHQRNQQRLTGGETQEHKEQPGLQREAATVDTAGQSLQRFDAQERESMRRLYASACRRTFFEALVAVCLTAHSFEKCLRKVVNSWPLLRTAVALPEEDGGGAEQLKELLKKAAALLRSTGGAGVGAAARSATATTGLGSGGVDGHSDAEERGGEATTAKRSAKGTAAGGGAAGGSSHDALEAIRELMEELHKKLQAATKEEEPTPLSDSGGEAGVAAAISSGC